MATQTKKQKLALVHKQAVGMLQQAAHELSAKAEHADRHGRGTGETRDRHVDRIDPHKRD